MNAKKRKTLADDKNKKTIDTRHSEIMHNYHIAVTEEIPKLIIEKAALKEKAVKCHANRRQTEEQWEIIERLCEIRKRIKQIHYEHNQYLLLVSDCVFQYYNDKQLTSSGNNMKNKESVYRFFNQSTLPASADQNVAKKINQEYWMKVDNEVTYPQLYSITTELCVSCNIGEMISHEEDGTLVCNNNECGKYVTHIIDSQKPIHKEMPNEICYTPYMRLNHFKEILSQFQAKQTTKIADEIIENILKRIKKERDVPENMTYMKLRNIMDILDYNKYFEHIPYILSMFGINPPIMDNELVETLLYLFTEIQQPWALCCPPDRVNFFNYTYTLYQLCTLVNQHQYLPYIPITSEREMKNRAKQLEQDFIWKKVCEKLDWEYFPTV